MPARRILVLHGPNLNLLVGSRSVEAIDAQLQARATALGVELKSFQSNWEGALLDTLAAQRHWFDGLIVNPASLAPSAVALAEAIELLGKPAIEVQLDDAKKGKSALRDVVEKQISNKGPSGYLEALVALVPGKKTFEPEMIEGRPTAPQRKPADRPQATKSLGRAAPEPEIEAAPPQKSLGRAVQNREAEALAAPKSLGRDKTIGRVMPNGDIVKSIGGKQRPALNKKPPPPSAPQKSVGRRAPAPASNALSRAVVRQQIADRLAGTVTPAALAAWARAEWQKVQSGHPMESGQRETLEDVLQQLLLSATMKASDDQLIELMTQLS